MTKKKRHVASRKHHPPNSIPISVTLKTTNSARQPKPQPAISKPSIPYSSPHLSPHSSSVPHSHLHFHHAAHGNPSSAPRASNSCLLRTASRHSSVLRRSAGKMSSCSSTDPPLSRTIRRTALWRRGCVLLVSWRWWWWGVVSRWRRGRGREARRGSRGEKT